MAERTVRIVFYRARPRLDTDLWPGGLYPVDAVADAITNRAAMAGDDKYVQGSGHQLLGLHVPSVPDVHHLAVYRIRSDMLPEVETGGSIQPLELAKDAKLADPSHWIFFEQNVVATLATRDGPGRGATSNYLERVMIDGRPTIEMVPIARRDVIQELHRSGEARSGVLRVDMNNLDAIAGASSAARRAMRGLGNSVGAGSLEIIFRPPEGTRARQEFADRTKGFFRSIREGFGGDHAPAGLDKLQVGVTDEDAPGHVTKIDLLADDIAAYREIPLVVGTRHVDPRAAQAAIINAYNEMLPELNDAVAAQD